MRRGRMSASRQIVYNAVAQGYEVIGIRKGWEGLMYLDPQEPATQAENAMILTKARVRDIDRFAGSFLHSSRVEPAHVRRAVRAGFSASRGRRQRGCSI